MDYRALHRLHANYAVESEALECATSEFADIFKVSRGLLHHTLALLAVCDCRIVSCHFTLTGLLTFHAFHQLPTKLLVISTPSRGVL